MLYVQRTIHPEIKSMSMTDVLKNQTVEHKAPSNFKSMNHFKSGSLVELRSSHFKWFERADLQPFLHPVEE